MLIEKICGHEPGGDLGETEVSPQNRTTPKFATDTQDVFNVLITMI